MIDSSARLYRRALVSLLLLSALAISQQPGASAPETKVGAQTVIAVGDMVDCPNVSGGEGTAKLADAIPGTILALGDLSYPDGSDKNFNDCYSKTWGRHKARTRPAPGNHEYHTPGASGYLKYFGSAAGQPGHAYYSFDLGNWHLISLDSECAAIGGCQKGSSEELWLRDDLRHNSGKCILAYWHVPLFSSGDEHGNAPEMKPFWDDLYVAGADIVLNGHDHDYERFAPQNPEGSADAKNGIREFVVGTGGKSQRGFRRPSSTSEVRSDKTYGVLKLTLRASSYQWEFVPVAGGHFSDSGSGTCHATPAK
ncbi:MAG TPA: metallophosphoesterase [Verrucomicrobiae bacterium]|jgi:hypothetical protein|nr:metallophosphoesterase [Verrucomicrobiae bacterium]